MRPRSLSLRLALGALLLAAGLTVAADFAEARVGRGGSFGSRGTRTWSTPAPTPTAPTAQPMQRSTTPQSQMGQTAARAPGGFFNRGGFMGGLMGGLLGAGLFGLLFGSGFFSGLGSLAGILGLLLQVALVVIVVRLVMGWMRSRNQPSYAGGARPDPMQREALNGGAPMGGTPMGGAPMGGAGAAPRAGFGTGPRGRPIQLQGSDFDTFERRLEEIQTAYGRADRDTLLRLATPEMGGYLREELDQLERDGLENRLGDVKLLQGDLSEAWAEDGSEYATVAMRYELTDVIAEKATGRIVQGDPSRKEQVVEFWTFVRSPGGEWLLSAIQQG